MRVGFFGQTGPFAPPALRSLLGQAHDFEIVLVVESKKLKAGRMEQRLRKPRSGPLPEGDSLVDLARAAGISVLESCDVNAPVAIRTILDFELDWIVCVGFDRLFSREVIATAKSGAMNAHPSLLPRWRGPSPLFWAIRQNEHTLGVSIHAIDEKEDHGPIYAQTPFVAPPRASGEDLYRLAATIAAPLIAGALALAGEGRLVGVPQDHDRACRAPRPKPEDSLVDPGEWGCEHLVDFCCVAPFSRAAWMRFGDDTFFVRRGISAEPGRRLPASYVIAGSTIIVQCRDGLARLELQV